MIQNMKLIRVENKVDGGTRYASSRNELKELLGTSEQSISRVVKGIAQGQIITTKNSIVRLVEIDESSIKEVFL